MELLLRRIREGLGAKFTLSPQALRVLMAHRWDGNVRELHNCVEYLAYLDKPQIAEELSKVALVEIIVPVAVYALKSGVENLSKNNRWPDRAGGEAPAEGEPEDREEEIYDC